MTAPELHIHDSTPLCHLSSIRSQKTVTYVVDVLLG